jgi:hypothetical protein
MAIMRPPDPLSMEAILIGELPMSEMACGTRARVSDGGERVVTPAAVWGSNGSCGSSGSSSRKRRHRVTDRGDQFIDYQ